MLAAFEAPYGPAWLFFGVGAAIVLGPIVATRLKLPAIIGLLAGGLVIGPAVFGIVPSTDTTVSALGQLGLLYLMFTAGVELDLLLFRRYRKAALTFGLMTFGAPMLLGFTAGELLDYSFAASLLLGSLWASHTLVTYPMVRKAGLSGDRAVATTVGATLITDTLSLIVLAGVSGSVTGGGNLASIVGSLLLGLVLLVVYALVLLPRGTRWFFSHVTITRDERYSVLLAAMLSAAVIAEVVGIEGIVGAFFAGLGVNRLVPAGSALMERVEFFGTSLLVPVFLVSVGVIIEPSVMIQPATLGLAAVFCAAVVGGKAVAAWLARPGLGFSRPEAGLMFGLSVSQAAATLAATFVGYDIGLFGEQVVNAVLVVILVTLLTAALVTNRAIGRVPRPPGDEDIGIGHKVLLVPGREDRLGQLARVGAALAEVEAGIVLPLRVSRAADDGDRQLLHLAESALTKCGLDSESRLRLDDDPVAAVAYTTLEEDASVVVMDWQAASRPQPALRGDRDDGLLDAVTVPVVLAAMSDTPWTRVVLALNAVDLAPEAAADLALAVDVATRLAPDATKRLVVGPESAATPEGFAASHDVANRADWVRQQASAGDLIVLPAHPTWSEFGPTAVRASAYAGVSAVVVATPQRWTSPRSALERGIGVLVGGTTPAVHWA